MVSHRTPDPRLEAAARALYEHQLEAFREWERVIPAYKRRWRAWAEAVLAASDAATPSEPAAEAHVKALEEALLCARRHGVTFDIFRDDIGKAVLSEMDAALSPALNAQPAPITVPRGDWWGFPMG